MLVRFKRKIITLTIICIIASVGYVRKAVTPTVSNISVGPTIILDAGHGGFDGGAGAHDGTLEKDVNLEISLKVKDFLSFYGYDVIMTRTKDTGTEDDQNAKISTRKKSDLKNRLDLMDENKNSIFVSVHLNKFTTSAASGTQVFYTPNFEQAKALADNIQDTVISLLQPENHRVIKKGTDSTYLLKNATVPAVIVECGFLSNKSDLEKLKNDDYQSDLAFCIACGIMKYYDLSGQVF